MRVVPRQFSTGYVSLWTPRIIIGSILRVERFRVVVSSLSSLIILNILPLSSPDSAKRVLYALLFFKDFFLKGRALGFRLCLKLFIPLSELYDFLGDRVLAAYHYFRRFSHAEFFSRRSCRVELMHLMFEAINEKIQPPKKEKRYWFLMKIQA